MKVAATPHELREILSTFAQPRVLVPTMGALHAGHVALIRKAREEAGPDATVIVSIFVNPIQFDRVSDLAAYPRTLEKDLAICEVEGVDLVFTPETTAMYYPDRSITVTESSLAAGLCGASRPGHFDGVCTVVLKLFNLSGCQVAVFGEKDFQQLAIIRRMVRDLDISVKIVASRTLREIDGLAMSSRNVRLGPAERADAPRIQRSLETAIRLDSPKAILASARAEIEASPLARIEYLSLVDAETLEPATDLDRPVVLATAVFYGEVRLIDNVSRKA